MVGINAFLHNLRAFESGINPEQFNWYVSNFNKKVFNYPTVYSPGELKRDFATGNHLLEAISVRRYFEVLGVLDMFSLSDPTSLHLMQYHAINPWGFVGYQIGEAILKEAGYYIPEKVTHRMGIDDDSDYERYYFGSYDNSLFSDGRREGFYKILEDDSVIIATDTNRWAGTFSGKTGLFSFEDLKQPEKQDAVMKNLMSHNLKIIQKKIALSGTTLSAYLEHRWLYREEYISCSLSGILACAHLCGAQGVVDLLLKDKMRNDELGTPILLYMQKFGGYDLKCFDTETVL